MRNGEKAGVYCGALLLVTVTATLAAAIESGATKMKKASALRRTFAWSASTTKDGRGAYRLSNGKVELVFVPQIGRIMRYGPVNGANVLWNNPDLLGKTTDLSKPVTDWPNYGGDKLWPAPQSVWGWPPDATFESAPHTVEILPNHHLRTASPVSEKHGLRFVRDIALDAKTGNVTIRNTMINTAGKLQTWGVWEIAQTDDPSDVEFPANRGGKFPKGYYIFGEGPIASRTLAVPERVTEHMNWIYVARDPLKAQKVGSDVESGNIIAFYSAADRSHEILFTVSAKRESGGTYPDDGCNLEVYTNPDPAKYIEMELLAPVRTLAPGAKTAYVTHWSWEERVQAPGGR